MTVVPFKRPSDKDSKQPRTPPMFNVPPATLRLTAALVAVHAVFSLMPAGMVEVWGYRLAFVPARYTGALPFDAWALVSPFSHLFLHAGWMHLAMNATMLLAFGAGTERMLGGRRTLALFVLSGLAGAATQFALAPFSPIPMVGASGALSGLFAIVAVRLLRSGMMRGGRMGIWGIAALWIGLSFVTALLGGALGMGNVAWAAHAGGFLAGIGLARTRYFS